MNRSSTIRKGFTLIELIAVVVILAILAGVALPRYFDYAAQAKESACKGTLGGVRAGIANFYSNGAISGNAVYPTLAQMQALGTVMQEAIPANPYQTGANAASIAQGTFNASNPPTHATHGWLYDPSNGRFWAATNTVGENAW